MASLAISIALIASVILNVYLILNMQQIHTNLKMSVPSGKLRNEFRLKGKQTAELKSQQQQIVRSNDAFNRAAKYSGEGGTGFQGWLWLLSSVDIFKGNVDGVENLVSNYLTLNADYSSLALSELLDSTLTEMEKEAIIPHDTRAAHEVQLQSAVAQLVSSPDLPTACSTHAFTTLISTWSLPFDINESAGASTSSTNALPSSMNDAIYAKSVAAYEELKSAYPSMSSTDLNHALFRVQMSKLEVSSTFWGNFQEIPGFTSLVWMMRKAAFKFLVEHGLEPRSAMRKANHPLVVWASVHTIDSVHQPHVTQDALVGGVYYVRVPRGSGVLEMYDARGGKHPLRDLDDPTSPPNPPFHRTLGVQPVEGKLVLFPGWLVHSVLPPVKAEEGGQEYRPGGDKDKYRVSLSFNLKGEWQDTASLHFVNCSSE